MPKKKKVLFICTGNVCRSPMAEYLLRDRLGKNSMWEILSAGLSTCHGMSASEAGVQVLRERGIDMSQHLSQPVSRELVDDAAIIVVMTASHLAQLRDEYPDVIEKSFLIKSFDSNGRGGDLVDPIGSSVDVYRGIRNQIEAVLPVLTQFMKSLETE